MGQLIERFAGLAFGVRAGVSIGLLAVIGGIYFYWLYLPTAAELEAARAKLAQVEAKLAESRRTAAQLPAFKEDVLRLNQELLVALSQLPEEKEIPDLLAQISRVGQDSGLDVQSFRPGPEQRQDLYASIPVQLKAVGTFHQVLVFFDRVSRLPRIVNVSDVAMGEAKEINGRFRLTATFTATTYRFLPDAAPAAASRPAGPGSKGAQGAR